MKKNEFVIQYCIHNAHAHYSTFECVAAAEAMRTQLEKDGFYFDDTNFDL